MALAGNYKIAFPGIAGIVFALLLQCTSEPVAPPAMSAEHWRMPVSGLRAEYDLSKNRILLAWDMPSFQFDYYRIYRTYQTNLDGSVDTTTLESTELRERIHKDSTTFSDLPDPENAVYYYAIQAVRRSGSDTVAGELSNLATCFTGRKVSFSINGNDPVVITNRCSLYVFNPGSEIESVRFTQSRIFINPAKPTDTTTRLKIWIPLFDPYDSLDSARVFSDLKPDSNRIQWVLGPGTGEKFVYAEVTYKPGANRPAKDTLRDLIRTSPHTISINLRNSDDSLRQTSMAIGPEQSVSMTILYQPVIKFGIRLFGDEGLEKNFGYKLVVVDESYTFDKSAIEFRGLLETPVIADSFELLDDSLINEGHEYVVRIDSTNTSLTWLKLIKKSGTEQISGTPAELAKRLLSILSTQRIYGRKEFRLEFKFVDKYFKDTITTVMGFEGDKQFLKTAMDVYPPIINFEWVKNPDHLNNYSIIDRPFSFALYPDPDLKIPSISDTGGGANIVSVYLVIASKPANWTKDMSFDELISTSRYRVFPYAVPAPSPTLFNVRWDNIDPTTWPSGMYVMGVYIEDEFGVRGFAPPSVESDNISNPWVVEVRSPK